MGLCCHLAQFADCGTVAGYDLSRDKEFDAEFAYWLRAVQKVMVLMDIVKQQLALSNEATLTPQTQFTALGADSLDTVEIVMGFEEEFGITLEEENSQNIYTVQEAADLIEKLLEKKDA